MNVNHSNSSVEQVNKKNDRVTTHRTDVAGKENGQITTEILSTLLTDFDLAFQVNQSQGPLLSSTIHLVCNKQ